MDNDINPKSCDIGNMSERFGKTSGQLQRWYLREWRKHRGMTQEQLAEAIDSTKQTVSRMESGTRSYNQPFLEACADALNCRPSDLLLSPPNECGAYASIIAKISSKSEAELKRISEMIDLLELR